MYYEKKSNNKLVYYALSRLSKYNPHFHNEVEIIINMGNGALADMYVNTQKYRLNEGDGILIMPGQVHTSDTIEEGLFFAFNFPVEYTPKLANFLMSKQPLNPVFNLDNTDTKHIIMEFWGMHDKLFRHAPSHVLSTLTIGYMNVLMCQLLETIKFNDISSDMELFRKIILYITENYTEQITLKELSDALKVPTALISRVFNSTSGITVPSFLNWVRASAAAELLTSTKDSITTISSRVGFGTIRNFNRAFMEFYGTTPSKYRSKSK